MSKNQCYVYIYLDPRKPGKYIYENYIFEYEPFYVGCGINNRLNQHIYETRNLEAYNIDKITEKHKIIKEILDLNIKPIIIKYKENLTEKESLNLESNLIKTIGRLDFEKGPLTNLTDGESGTNYSKYTREKISQAVQNYWDSERGLEKKKRGSERFKEWHKNNDINGNKNPNFKNSWNEKQRKHLSDYLKNSGMHKGKNNPKFKYVYLLKNLIDGKIFEIFSLKTFCDENNLIYDSLRRIPENKNQNGFYKNIWYIERKVYNESNST